MATGEDWSLDEVEATVADYFEMLVAELAGSKPNKAERNRLLRERLHGRSHGSVEFKHQNISAVLREANLPYVDGYKPRGNYQGLLWDAIRRFLERHPEVLSDVGRSDFAVIASAAAENLEVAEIFDDPPSRTAAELIRERERTYVARKRDLAMLEARRRSLGLRGEEFVLRLERRRLSEAGQSKLANSVEHISETRGDGAGYDIRSFEEDGRDRLIEVKTTTYGKHQPFIVSINEVEFSNDFAEAFHLYRLFNFGSAERIFTLKGPLPSTCNLEPVQYRATV